MTTSDSLYKDRSHLRLRDEIILHFGPDSELKVSWQNLPAWGFNSLPVTKLSHIWLNHVQVAIICIKM